MTSGHSGSTAPPVTGSTVLDGWMIGELRTLRSSLFYGKLIIELRGGEVYLIREERTIKPPKGI